MLPEAIRELSTKSVTFELALIVSRTLLDLKKAGRASREGRRACPEALSCERTRYVSAWERFSWEEGGAREGGEGRDTLRVRGQLCFWKELRLDPKPKQCLSHQDSGSDLFTWGMNWLGGDTGQG